MIYKSRPSLFCKGDVVVSSPFSQEGLHPFFGKGENFLSLPKRDEGKNSLPFLKGDVRRAPDTKSKIKDKKSKNYLIVNMRMVKILYIAQPSHTPKKSNCTPKCKSTKDTRAPIIRNGPNGTADFIVARLRSVRPTP